MRTDVAGRKTLIRSEADHFRLPVSLSAVLLVAYLAVRIFVLEESKRQPPSGYPEDTRIRVMQMIAAVVIAVSLFIVYNMFRSRQRDKSLLALCLFVCGFVFAVNAAQWRDCWVGIQMERQPTESAMWLIYQYERQYFAKHRIFASAQQLCKSDPLHHDDEARSEPLGTTLLAKHPWGLFQYHLVLVSLHHYYAVATPSYSCPYSEVFYTDETGKLYVAYTNLLEDASPQAFAHAPPGHPPDGVLEPHVPEDGWTLMSDHGP